MEWLLLDNNKKAALLHTPYINLSIFGTEFQP